MKTISKYIAFNAQSMGVIILLLLVGFSSCKKDSTTTTNGMVSYTGTFVKSTATTVTTATGTVTGTFNPTTMVLTYSMNWSGLTSNAAAMHFHDGAITTGSNVIIPITGFATATSGTFSGTATFTAAQATDLAAGMIYIQIHSVNIPAGEILATLTKVSSPVTTGGGGGVGGY